MMKIKCFFILLSVSLVLFSCSSNFTLSNSEYSETICSEVTLLSYDEVTVELTRLQALLDEGFNYPMDQRLTPVNNPVQSVTEVTLIAGQNIDAGSVTVNKSGDDLLVTFSTKDGWQITETHLHVVNDGPGFPVTKKNSPKIGNFMYMTEHDPAVVEYTYLIDDIDINQDIFIAAHAVVVKLDENNVVVESETAWGEGTPFGKSWAMYFSTNLKNDIYAIGKWEVTQASGDFKIVMGYNPAIYHIQEWKNKKPVYNVSWYEAAEYCNTMTRKLIDMGEVDMGEVYLYDETGDLTGEADFSKYGFYLPTNEQWEQSTVDNSPHFFATEIEAVTSYILNVLGVGGGNHNVAEWINDWYDADNKSIRGGSFLDSSDIRYALPVEKFDDVGFRVALGGFGHWVD